MIIDDMEFAAQHWSFYDVKEQLRQHVNKRSELAFTAGDKARDRIISADDMQARNEYMRKRFIDAVGGLPSSSTPLNPRNTGTISCDGFKIEKIIFESRPDIFVTANMYIPDGLKSPAAAVLFVCGHHRQAKHQEEYQMVCQYLVRAGLVVLSIDPIGQGERFSYYEKTINDTTVGWGSFEHDYAGAQCHQLGRCIASYFIHDSMRAIDYLCSRPEVDPRRIGVTGNSGGGMQTAMLMVCEPRIAAAAPATFIMNGPSFLKTGLTLDSEQIWPEMSSEGFDHEDILMQMAPRPVLILAVKYDFFPIEGTRRTFERSIKFWDFYNKTECLEMYEDVSEHLYTGNMARKAAEFFSHHLSGTKTTPSNQPVTDREPKLLWCTQSGQVRGEISGAKGVYEENIALLKQLEDKRKAITDIQLREQASIWLKEKVFANRRPTALNMRKAREFVMLDFKIEDIVWWSQDDIFNHAFIFTGDNLQSKKTQFTIAVWDGGTQVLQRHIEWIRKECSTGRNVMVLDVSGVGVCRPNDVCGRPHLDFEGIIHKLSHDLLWLGDSLAALRTYDITRAIDMLQEYYGANSIQLYSHGRYGVYAQLAAFIDHRVIGLKIADGMGSYKSWVSARHYDHHDIHSIVLPGVLKHFDLPDLERWISE